MTVDYSAAALAAARRYCGWVVTPPETVTITLEGEGGRVLSLPSLQVVELDSVEEDGVALDVDDLIVSADKGTVRKKSGRCWTLCGQIVVTMTHGFDDAPDFDAAVEQAARSLTNAASAAGRDDSAMKRKRIDDVDYEWYPVPSQFLNSSLLAPYTILLSP